MEERDKPRKKPESEEKPRGDPEPTPVIRPFPDGDEPSIIVKEAQITRKVLAKKPEEDDE